MSDTTPLPSTDGEGLAQRLLDQVASLQQRIDKAERRVRIERALADAQAADVQAAADELEHDAGGADADLPALVRKLKRTKPGLFTAPTTSRDNATTAPAPNAPPPDQHLTILREKARTGDRASLLLYLRARRSKE
jgi:hypothetical protein